MAEFHDCLDCVAFSRCGKIAAYYNGDDVYGKAIDQCDDFEKESPQ